MSSRLPASPEFPHGDMKLLLLVVRGLQTSIIGPYGNRWIDTPNFDLLAEAGTVFDRHFAVRPEMALLAPEVIEAIRVASTTVRVIRDISRGAAPGSPVADEFDGTERTLAAARKALRSHDGLLVVEFASLLPPWRISQQFLDAIFATPSDEAEERDEDEDDEEDEEDEDEAEGMELLPEEEPLEPHLTPALGPIDPNDDTLFLRLQSTYAAAVQQFDAVMGELLNGLPDDVTLLVTSDAGLALGEHGQLGHGAGLYQETIHVPFLAVGPGITSGGRTDVLTSTADVATTVAAAFGVTWPGGFDLLQPLVPREALVLEARGERAIRTPTWFLRCPVEGPPTLHEKPADRGDVLDISGAHFEMVEELMRRLGEMSSV